MDAVNGQEMYKWCKELFPINRSLTGHGVRQTLSYLKELIPDLKLHEVPSGTKAFDWTVPKEWNVSEAWIEDPAGRRIVDFQENNLHLMGYSTPVNCQLELADLLPRLHSLPELPHAIPYLTSYYREDWGFCITHEQKLSLTRGKYRVKIDSDLQAGHMTYGELILPGKSADEVLLTSYVCHPSMANNELSGPVVLTSIAMELSKIVDREYTYRILFIPETIGSIFYLSQHLEYLKANVVAGWVLTCIGDDRNYSFMPTKRGDTFTDRISRTVFRDMKVDWHEFSWLERGSDERQFNSPGVDIPIASFMRSKYGEYPEYHTSLDDLSVISASGLAGGFNLVWGAITILEQNKFLKMSVLCEPQLGKRGLYPQVSTRESYFEVADLMNVISYLDGEKDLIEVSELCNLSFRETFDIALTLQVNNLVN